MHTFKLLLKSKENSQVDSVSINSICKFCKSFLYYKLIYENLNDGVHFLKFLVSLFV